MTGGMARWGIGLSLLVALACSASAEEATPAADQASSPMDEALAQAETAASQPAGAPADDATEPAPTKVSMDFKDADLKDVLKAFSQQTGINLIAGQDVSGQKITLYLQDVAVIDALDQILRAGSLVYERLPGSDIYVVKKKVVAQVEAVPTITKIYRVRYARVSTSVLAKAATAFGSRTPFETATEAGSDSSSSSGSSSGSTSSSPALGGASTDVGVDVIIKEMLTENGKVTVDPRTNSLIITDVADNFPKIEAVLAGLDVRTPQVLVDAELIETTLSKLKDLGVEWGTGASGNLLSFTPGSRTTRFPFGILPDSMQPTGPTPFSTATLNATSFTGVLQALEKDTDSKILARPKVLTLDNESALIRMTADEAIGFTTSSQTGTGTQTSEPERTTTGVLLVVTPQVNDNSYITMLVEPSVTKTIESKISPPSGQATPRDPKTRSSRTLVRIKSGDTLVVGGLIDRSDQHVLRKVPILSGIPFVGEAFKDKEINDSASELIVFITPTVLKDAPTQVAAAGAAPYPVREQGLGNSRQEKIEQTLNHLEQPQGL